MAKVPTVTLSSGTKVPAIAFGIGTLDKTTFQQSFVDKAASAIANGYRHFDCAERYHSDQELGVAISESGIPRSEFFITNKVYPQYDNFQKLKSIETSLRKSLEDLQTEYIDLYLIHNPFFPPGSLTIAEAWRQMEEVKEKGLAREIGISNFEPVDIEKVLKVARIKPAVNQIELHPYVWHEAQATLKLCAKHDIKITAYSPLMPIARHPSGPLPPTLESIAQKQHSPSSITSAQVLLKWLTDKGYIVITSSKDLERQKNQIDLSHVKLDKEDVKKIEEEGKKYQFRLFGWGVFAKEYKSVL